MDHGTQKERDNLKDEERGMMNKMREKMPERAIDSTLVVGAGIDFRFIIT